MKKKRILWIAAGMILLLGSALRAIFLRPARIRGGKVPAGLGLSGSARRPEEWLNTLPSHKTQTK